MSTADKLTEAMQNEVIKVAEQRLKYLLPPELVMKVCQNKWSYIGLEMMIDTVKYMEVSEIESYLGTLD